ncbi:MAG: hypothetical protein ACP5LF_06610 [Nitrososphaeria archaeon]
MQGHEKGSSPGFLVYYVVPFNIVHEDLSVYSLEDGNTLRARVILVSLSSSEVPLKKGVDVKLETQVIVKADVPPNRRGHRATRLFLKRYLIRVNYPNLTVGASRFIGALAVT